MLGYLREEYRQNCYATTIPFLVTIRFTSSTLVRRLIDEAIIQLTFNKSSYLMAVCVEKQARGNCVRLCVNCGKYVRYINLKILLRE